MTSAILINKPSAASKNDYIVPFFLIIVRIKSAIKKC